ncbi:MAG TPA: hypothetical protein VJ949_08005 [Cryomorphaceae bacterium]|nr:hypothetical protein [Cryomorphaceae bacterium]
MTSKVKSITLQKEDMDLESRKISFIQEFLRLQNEEIIEGLEQLLRKKKAEVVEKNAPMTLEEFNDEIDQAMEDSNNNRMIEVAELREKYNK